eukprot:COSAG03_NODE_19449_length_336_cov_1.000000_1_plen_26_part_01
MCPVITAAVPLLPATASASQAGREGE